MIRGTIENFFTNAAGSGDEFFCKRIGAGSFGSRREGAEGVRFAGSKICNRGMVSGLPAGAKTSIEAHVLEDPGRGGAIDQNCGPLTWVISLCGDQR